MFDFVQKMVTNITNMEMKHIKTTIILIVLTRKNVIHNKTTIQTQKIIKVKGKKESI